MATKRPHPPAEDDPGPRWEIVPDSQKGDMEDIASELARLSTETKRQRPDVTARRAANDNTDVSVVKTTLNSFCTDQAKALPWESVLKDMNKAVLEAYVLANIHVLRFCRAGRSLPVLDHPFYYKCLSAVSVGAKARKAIEDEDFRQSVDLYKSMRDPNVPFASCAHIISGWYQIAARQMATNTQNAVKLNFYRRFHKQIKRCYDMNGSEAYEMLKSILDPVYEGDDLEVLAWREKIPRKDNGYLDDQAHLLLPLTYMFLSDIEEWNRVFKGRDGFTEIRSFSLLPFKKGFECSHFKMCKTGLYSLLKRAGIALPGRGPAWNAVADEWWRRLFKIDKFETANRKFAGEILTDGKAVSIVMRKPKREAVERPLNEKDYDIMWGLDPGRRDLFVATNQSGKKLSCSTREFYEDAHYKKSKQKTDIWQENRPDVLEAIRNMPTSKTASLDRLREYVKFMIPRMNLLLEFRMTKPFRKLKLRRFIFSQKKLRALCLKLTQQAGRRTVVGFDDWSNTDISGLIKKAPAGPVKKLESELKKYCRVVPIDEFRTSKLHSKCHGEMKNQYSLRVCKDGEERTLKVYSVLHCRSNGCHGMTVNRDANASKNMPLLLQCELRG